MSAIIKETVYREPRKTIKINETSFSRILAKAATDKTFLAHVDSCLNMLVPCRQSGAESIRKLAFY